MNYLDATYRALQEYRKNTQQNSDCTKQRTTTVKTNPKGDRLTLLRRFCTVDTDWVEAIEEGLVHVDKAIREERQFIRSNGEIIEIEKVKNVSKDSVEHLAKHSNLITRYDGEGDIVPDKLYTVERLSDYAVYENRFLYMLLCYLRDFITLRYNQILNIEHTYNGSYSTEKEIVMPKRNVTVTLTLKEERKDDPFLEKISGSSEIIGRIRDCLQLVHAFLATPLMGEVAKVAMLKPPVTKTNVLRMNHNFRGALALYEFVSAYDKDGYTVYEETREMAPLKPEVAEDFAEMLLLASHLTYEHSLGVKDELHHRYLIEEEDRQMAEEKRQQDKLASLRRRLKESGEDPEEYILLLEQRNRTLEKEVAELAGMRQEMRSLQQSVHDLQRTVSTREEDAYYREQQHRQDMEALSHTHADEISNLRREAKEEKAQLQRTYEAKLEDAKNLHDQEISNMQNTLAISEEMHQKKLEADKRAHLEATQALESSCQEKQAKIHQLQTECEQAENAYHLTEARLTALRYEKGLATPTDDLTSEEAFTELEQELELFKKFFNAQWKQTKKQIRREMFGKFFRGETSAPKEPQTQDAPLPTSPTTEEATAPQTQLEAKATTPEETQTP